MLYSTVITELRTHFIILPLPVNLIVVNVKWTLVANNQEILGCRYCTDFLLWTRHTITSYLKTYKLWDRDIRLQSYNQLALHCMFLAVSLVHADENGNLNVFVTLYCQNNRQKVCGQVFRVISSWNLVLFVPNQYHRHSIIDWVS